MLQVTIDMEIDGNYLDPICKRVEYRHFASEDECNSFVNAYEALHCVKVIYCDWCGDLLYTLVKH